MIPASVEKELCEWFVTFPSIEKVILFGSRARGDFNERSDIDLMVKAPNMTQVDWLDFVFRMKEETNTLLSIDVILWAEASEGLRKRVEEEGRVLYERS